MIPIRMLKSYKTVCIFVFICIRIPIICVFFSFSNISVFFHLTVKGAPKSSLKRGRVSIKSGYRDKHNLNGVMW